MPCQSWKMIIEQSLDDSGHFDPKTREHLRNCPVCRAYHQKLIQLDDLLSASVSHPFSSTHIQQLTNSAAESVFNPEHRAFGRKSQYSSNLFRRGVWFAACAAAVCIIAAVWLQQGPNQQTPAPPEGFTSMPQTISFDYSMSALASLPEQSMRSEMQQLLSDAQQVSVFLIQLMPTEPSQHASLPPE